MLLSFYHFLIPLGVNLKITAYLSGFGERGGTGEVGGVSPGDSGGRGGVIDDAIELSKAEKE